MQQLKSATLRSASAAVCAAEILDVVPAVMRFIRAEMRRSRGSDLSVPQFRALAFVSRDPGTSLTRLAEFIGLSLPATSRLVEGLVRKSLVVRRIPPGNRRAVALSLSVRGQRTVSTARQATERRLSRVLASSPGSERAMIRRALGALRGKFMAAAPRWDS